MGKVYFIFFICVSLIVGQTLKSTSEFKINEDVTPAIFIQHSPELYHTVGGDYNVVWNDTRDGVLGVYAQTVNSDLSLAGSNYKSERISPIRYVDENTYYSVRQHTGDGIVFVTNFYFEKVVNNEVVNSKLYATYIPPGCGVGAYGEEMNIIPCDSSILVVTKLNGPLVIDRFDYAGNQITASRDSGCTVFSGKHAVGVLDDGSYAILYIDPQYDSGYQTGLISFYDSNDEILSDSVDSGIFKAQKEAWVPEDINAGIQIFDNGNNEYLAFALNPDSAIIRSKVFSKTGEPIARDRIFHLPVNWVIDNYSRKVTNFNTTELETGRFAVIASVEDQMNEKTYNFQLYCDQDGVFEAGYFIDSTLTFKLADDLVFNPDGSLIVTSEINNDIYIERLNGLKLLEQKKINDDISGGNEFVFQLYSVSDDQVFASYNDLQNNYGRIISSTGELGEIKASPREQNLMFFSDGSSCAEWFDTNPTGRSAGLKYYDENFNITRIDSFLYQAPPAAGKMTTRVLKNNMIAVYTIINLNEAVISLYNKDGEMLVTEEATQFGVAGSIDLIPLEDGTFYLVNSGKVLRLNQTLQPVTGTIYTFDKLFKYLSGNMFLEYWQSETAPGTIEGKIIDIETNEIIMIDLLAEVSYSVFVFPVGERGFIVSFLYNDNIVYNYFDYSGNKIEINKAVCGSPNDTRSAFRVASTGEHIYYFWSEINDQSTGYDVYGKVYSFNELSGIEDEFMPEKFVLNQNYPNPFNPETTIGFYLPVETEVTITIYDILGSDVEEIFNGRLHAGNNEFKFNANKLSSGIYFYEVSSAESNFRAVRKMILMK